MRGGTGEGFTRLYPARVNETAAFGAGAIARVRGAPAWTITALGGLLYVIAAPPSTDLAAAAYRSNLFSRVGFTLWDN